MRLVLGFFAFFISCQVSANSITELFRLDIELASEQTLPLGTSISFELESVKAAEIEQSLSDWDHIITKLIDSSRLAVTMQRLPQFNGKPVLQNSAASFVIDFEEASTQTFISGFKAQYGDSVQLDNIAEYVSGYIDDPTYIHNFNFASVAAAQRSGDCTEYAVLTTALARALSLPARVVFGVVIMEEKDRVDAYGHAWTEVWQGDKWHTLDAALYPSQAIQHFYLPSGTLENEGPGYAISVINMVNLIPQKIRQLRSW